MKSGTANTTSAPGDSTTNNNVGPDAMTWAGTWEMINRTLRPSPRRTPTRVKEEMANPGKPSRSRNNSKMIQMGASTHG